MPRKKTARKQGEEFVSKVSDKMVEDRFIELYPVKILQAMFVEHPKYKSKLLACIRAVMELEEVNHEIENIRVNHGVQASLVNIGPRGGITLTPLQRLRRIKVNQVLHKYRSIRQSPEWIIFRRVRGKPALFDAMSRAGRPPTEELPRQSCYGADSTEKEGKKVEKPPSGHVPGRRPRRRDIMEGSADLGPIESDSLHDVASAVDKSQKAPPITEADLARSIREFEKDPQRQRLLPHYGMAFQAMLFVLKSEKEEWEIKGSLAFNLNMRSKASEILRFLKSMLKEFF